MNLVAASSDFRRDQALDQFEGAVAQGLLPGVRAQDPMVAAFLRCLELLDWVDPGVGLFHSMPHFPGVFSLEDLRNSFHHLGVETRQTPVTSRALRAGTGPALLIDASGSPYVAANTDQQRALDPVSGEPRASFAKPGDILVTFHRPDEFATQPSSWFKSRLSAMRREFLRLLVTKLAIAAVSIASAFGIVGIYSAVIPARALDTLLAIGLGLAMVIASDLAFRRIRARTAARVAARSDYLATTEVLAKILSLPMERLGQSSVAAQGARARQLAATPSALTGSALEIAFDIPIAALMLTGLAFWSWQLALIPLAVCLFCGLLAWAAYPLLKARSSEARKARAHYNGLVHEICHGLGQIHANGEEDRWLAAVARAGRANARAQQRAAVLRRTLDAVAASAVPVAGGLIAVAGALLVMEGQITNGSLLAAMVISWRVLAPIQGAYQVLSRASDFRSQIKQIDALMGLPDEQERQAAPHGFDVDRSIEIRGAVCRYPGSSKNALSGISCKIPAGSFVALTGPSGAGKSTLLRSINGLCPLRAGHVMIGGVNSRQLPVSALRSLVAHVPETPAFIHGTLAQNLRLGKPSATDAELEELCGVFGLAPFLASLPDGIQTRLTAARQAVIPRGTAQALAVVRAVLREPGVLLLDDPADAMDSELEAALMNWLTSQRGDLTVLMATHRPSHVRAADFELKLRSGSAAGFGKPER
ncbi:ATP-binding cassette domain-containing protein [Leisingera aquaemixtae]|uniref:peptidase domain-containing ABC transporter n=1 Tax=Leisingera aquaemixtae TaxID=1396826 RepID=UPI001C965BBC|nr:ATP-binding cassette domain-containing protein [Leisingera aquaemixtae]MBY6068395.1 ATP-binding cassette domain-containing protein [Leisingera aquaemixtae]